MSHNKIKAAARQRMAATGEPYTAARRAALGQRQAAAGNVATPGHGGGYRLAMSGEIHDWLAGLGAAQPLAAEPVRQALAALIREGAGLGVPLAVPALDSWRSALPTALDLAYQDRLERVDVLRRGNAEAATLAKDIQDRLAELDSEQAKLDGERRRALDAGWPQEADQAADQAADQLAAAQREAAEMRLLLAGVTETCRRLSAASRWHYMRNDAFRTQREVLKASLIAADAAIRIGETFADPDLAAPGSDWEPEDDAGEAETRLRDLTARIERELGCDSCPEELMELRPGAPESSDNRILFTAEPPGTALLIAVLEGPDAIEDQYLDAVMASAEMLRGVRAGEAPEAAAHVYDDEQSFLAEFYPGHAGGTGGGSVAERASSVAGSGGPEAPDEAEAGPARYL